MSEAVESPITETPQVTSTEAGTTPSSAAEQTTEAESKPETKAGSEIEKPKRRDGGFQRRIDQLTREKYQLEATLAAERNARQQTQIQQPKGEPKREQYDTLDEYLEAKATHAAEAAADRRLRAFQEQHERVTAEQESKVLGERWEQAQESARDAIEDYDDVVSTSAAPVNRAMTQAIMESDVGPRIVYHLAAHPEIAERISKLSATSAAREIGKLEAKVLQDIEAAKTAKPKTAGTSPIAPVGAGGAASTGPSDKMPIETWMKARNADVVKRRGY